MSTKVTEVGDMGHRAADDLTAVKGGEEGPVEVARRRLGLPTGPYHSVAVGHDGGEQRHTLVGIHGQERRGLGTGHPGGRLREFVRVSDSAVHPAVLVLPDTFDQAFGGKGAEDRIDVAGQVRPHGQPRPGGDPGANRVDGVAGETVPS
ncbi:hypothetical protein AB0D09_02385 [Streptomyces sp. NPDC049097]|uniref:hypothetical protein n=1 Tax=Streptomyces sp. NPDC049097 TaxID=3155497 RepID=UPI00343BE76A